MTMQFIASATGNGSGAIFFNNIPQTFTHLQLRITGRAGVASTGANLYTNWYGSTSASTYSNHRLGGDGSTAYAGAETGLPYVFGGAMFPGASATANIMGSCIIDILDYTNVNKFKTLRMIGGNDRNGSGQVILASGLIQFSGAITTGYIDTEGAFTTATRADLYGISTSEVTGA
jgi:hypothetical protein